MTFAQDAIAPLRTAAVVITPAVAFGIIVIIRAWIVIIIVVVIIVPGDVQ
jgi:hypothetical protein